jgi:hypothetical protein
MHLKRMLAWICGAGFLLLAAESRAVAQSARDAAVSPAPGEPQVIHLDDQTKLTLLGTSHGLNHMAPGFENLRTANWIRTATNTTVVWIKEEHGPGKRPSYELLVSDRSNTGCVNLEPRQRSSVKDGVSLQSFLLTAFPRWDNETILRPRPYRGAASQEQFVLTNPMPATFALWTPEPLPSAKSDSDLEVTLTKLTAGAPVPYREGSSRAPTNDPANQCVHLDFDLRENGLPTTNWQAWPVQTTDVSGNHSRGLIYVYPKNGIYPSHPDRIHPSFPPENDGYYFQPGLWPDQPWKVRLELIRRFNFTDGEIVTFTNLPVKPGTKQDWEDQRSAWGVSKTSFPFIVTPGTVNGVHLKLLPPLLVQDSVSVIVGADPDFNPQGMNLTVVAATDDQGRDLAHPFGSSWAGHYDLNFPNVREIKTLNLKLALHKSRFVEFTIKPARQ